MLILNFLCSPQGDYSQCNKLKHIYHPFQDQGHDDVQLRCCKKKFSDGFLLAFFNNCFPPPDDNL